MSLKPVKRLEMILDGQDIEPVTRLEYFLKKAAEGGGGAGPAIHVVRAVGNVNVVVEDQKYIVTMNSDADEDTIDSWLNSGEPVFCLAPTVRYNDEQMSWYYRYTDVSMELVKDMEGSVSMTPNSRADSLTFSQIDGVFEWVITMTI